MKTGILSHLSGAGKLGILVLIIFSATIVLGFLGLLFASLYTGIGMDSAILSNYDNPDTIVYMKIMQIFQAIGIFIVPPIVALKIFRNENENYLQFRSSKILLIIISGALMLLALPIINWVAELNQNMSLPQSWASLEEWMHNQEMLATNITKYFLKADNIPTLLLNLFIMAVIPAIGEEMLFRGILQKIFTQMGNNIHIGIWVTAFIFSAIHMLFFTFLPRFLMGAMFGYMLVWSGSIWLPIVAHFVNNGTAVIVNYLIQQGTIDSDIEKVGQQNISYLISSIILVSAGMYYLNLKKITKPRAQPSS